MLFDMENSISHGRKYESPPRTDLPMLEMHPAEYEASAPCCIYKNNVHQHFKDIIFFARRGIQTRGIGVYKIMVGVLVVSVTGA